MSRLYNASERGIGLIKLSLNCSIQRTPLIKTGAASKEQIQSCSCNSCLFQLSGISGGNKQRTSFPSPSLHQLQLLRPTFSFQEGGQLAPVLGLLPCRLMHPLWLAEVSCGRPPHPHLPLNWCPLPQFPWLCVAKWPIQKELLRLNSLSH